MDSTYSDTCYGTRNSCPSSTSISSCYHFEDITVTSYYINLLYDIII